MSAKTSFQEAREIIKNVATVHYDVIDQLEETVSLTEAVGRIVSCNVLSPRATPTFDSSAMDGYAVCSAHTTRTSPSCPLLLKVRGCIMAGDSPVEISPEIVDGYAPCVEMMTGAAFPSNFDACIPYEQTLAVKNGIHSPCGEFVQILRPAVKNQHKRLAGSDYRKGDIIIKKNSMIEPKCCMAAASVGMCSLNVRRRIRVAVLSTGSELQPSLDGCSQNGPAMIPDVNGPYLISAIQQLDVEVLFIGQMADDVDAISDCIRKTLRDRDIDMIVSSGAVSAGKLDLIPQVIASLNGRLHFHHVAMRPGHPVLFASLPNRKCVQRPTNGSIYPVRGVENGHTDEGIASSVGFFGLPGNPVAAAATFRFLVVPYIRTLLGESEQPSVSAEIRSSLQPPQELNSPQVELGPLLRNPHQVDQFRHGRVRFEGDTVVVELSADQSPAKMKPFAQATCWVHVPRSTTALYDGDSLQVFPL